MSQNGIKREIIIKSYEEESLKLGAPAILTLTTGERVRTSPVQDFFIAHGRGAQIITQHTIYVCYL